MDLNWYENQIVSAILHPPVSGNRPFIGFYPSSASVEWEEKGLKMVGGGCLRAQAYRVAQVPATNPIAPDDAIKAAVGNWVHAGLVEMAKQSRIWFGDEISFFREGTDELPPISGRGDQFTRDPVTKQPVGIEVKTIYSYWQIKEILGPEGRPRMKDVIQAFLCLDYYSQWGVTQWLLFYMNRGDGGRKTFRLTIGEQGQAVIEGPGFKETWDHLNIQSINERFARLKKHIEAKELPPRDFELQWSTERIRLEYEKGTLSRDMKSAVKKKLEAMDQGLEVELPLIGKGDFECNYCDWKDLCWGAEWHENISSSRLVNPFDPITFSRQIEQTAATDVVNFL